MAVFGNLSKFSLREILAVVGDRAGILSIETGAARGMRLRLRVVDERLTSLVLERSIDSGDEARVLLKRFANGQGAFRFETETVPDDEKQETLLPWEDVLSCLDGQQDRDDLPHPQTRFVLLKGRTASSQPDLDAFLRLSRPLLERGSSAEQLSKELNMEQKQVQQLLQRLREMKKIWPVRAYVEQSSTSAEMQQEKTLVAKRLTDLFAP